MSLTVSDLRERVTAQFPDAKQVGDSIICFTRRRNDLPFAVYYLDIASELPETIEKLTDYQDRVVGRHYFEGGKSLQWSNYVYFITDPTVLESKEVRKAKELIESDRSYARKFVISEEELDSVLKPSVVEPTGTGPQTNILSLWMERLTEAGLDGAIVGNADLPTRLEVIESSSPQPADRSKVQSQALAVGPSPFLRILELKNYREFPIRRSFEFGTVNLIVGTNGSGKTSLLEAIELFYCGRNKRNPTPPASYELSVRFDDGTYEKATASRSLQFFRDRNLGWYGQAEVKTSYLYQSFAQFNFLDTDAAVHLAESTSGRIEEDLSKLLVGPDASKVWRDMERVAQGLEARLRDLRPRDLQFDDELVSLDNRLREVSGIQQESDLIRARLGEMLRRLGWTDIDPREDHVARLAQVLSELVSLSRQATELEWSDRPASIEGLQEYCRGAHQKGSAVEQQIVHLEQLESDLKRLAGEGVRIQRVEALAKEAKRLVDAGVPSRSTDRAKEQGLVAKYSGWLAGLESAGLEAFSASDLDETVEAYLQSADAALFAARELLEKQKVEYKNFSQLRDQSARLAQELRQIAGRILETSNKPDECPLCHTQFQPGELAIHMAAGVDADFESVGQTMLGRIGNQEAVVRNATADKTTIDWLIAFSKRASLPIPSPVSSAVGRVEQARRELAEAQERLERLNRELISLEQQGLSSARFEQISVQLKEEGFAPSDISLDALEKLLGDVADESQRLARMVEEKRKEESQVKSALEAISGTPESSAKQFKTALARVKEQVVTTESILSKLKNFASSFAWPSRKSLAELAVEAESVRKMAVELQSTLGKERLAYTTRAESTKRRNILASEQGRLRGRIDRLTQAQGVLSELLHKHSLDKAMNAALQKNRTAVESIFMRIHAPAEFSHLGSTWTTLIRRNGGRETKLTEISTGQRAAFALSIFLAQNAQLTVAPPVVLIDDPIAHIDDLNSLSFLDYLRELTLTGRRQIYFATANEKLATLFERKFDFLGASGFRKIDLRREVM